MGPALRQAVHAAQLRRLSGGKDHLLRRDGALLHCVSRDNRPQGTAGLELRQRGRRVFPQRGGRRRRATQHAAGARCDRSGGAVCARVPRRWPAGRDERGRVHHDTVGSVGCGARRLFMPCVASVSFRLVARNRWCCLSIWRRRVGALVDCSQSSRLLRVRHSATHHLCRHSDRSARTSRLLVGEEAHRSVCAQLGAADAPGEDTRRGDMVE